MEVAAQKPRVGLGTFSGVYIPSVLTIFGVIMYLRMGVLVGSLGLVSSITIILLATSITLLTSLSIASSSTNMVVEGGGAYFLISRAFGKEIGASIGLPLYLAQSIGIAFYIAGFIASLSTFLPGIPAAWLGLATLGLLAILAYTSSNLAIKTQGIILFLIICSLVSFFLGEEVSVPVEIKPLQRLGFWPAFALFFPAVTGIEAGVSMSGDLKDPSKSLVRGVLAAVLTGLVVYLAIAWHLSRIVPRDVLASDPFIVQHLAKWGWMIIMGLWGATLSSSLGALLGAPRTLQALAQDGIMPKFLAKGFGARNEPRIATIFTVLVSGLCLYFGRIDVIAPLLTMFFLISYGMLNFAAGLEAFVQNPSWRPTFLIPPTISLLGGTMCLMAMLMINPGISFIAIFLVIVIYLIATRSSMTKGWDDIRRGILFLVSRMALYRLAKAEPSARSWRPNFLVLTTGYDAPTSLLSFTSRITKGKGLLIIASIFDDAQTIDLARNRIREVCKRKKVEALVSVSQHSQPLIGMEALIDSCGLGSLRPNTIVIGDASNRDDRENNARLILHAKKRKRNVVVIVGADQKNFIENSDEESESKRIDIWWDDNFKNNSMLMLVLAHMHQSSRGHRSTVINVRCTVPNETAREHRQKYFDDFFSRTRFRISTQVYVKDEDDSEARLREHFSRDANVVFCGLQNPLPDESEEEYIAYYQQLIKSHKKLHNVAYVLSGDKVDLKTLFS